MEYLGWFPRIEVKTELTKLVRYTFWANKMNEWTNIEQARLVFTIDLCRWYTAHVLFVIFKFTDPTTTATTTRLLSSTSSFCLSTQRTFWRCVKGNMNKQNLCSVCELTCPRFCLSIKIFNKRVSVATSHKTGRFYMKASKVLFIFFTMDAASASTPTGNDANVLEFESKLEEQRTKKMVLFFDWNLTGTT